MVVSKAKKLDERWLSAVHPTFLSANHPTCAGIGNIDCGRFSESDMRTYRRDP